MEKKPVLVRKIKTYLAVYFLHKIQKLNFYTQTYYSKIRIKIYNVNNNEFK